MNMCLVVMSLPHSLVSDNEDILAVLGEDDVAVVGVGRGVLALLRVVEDHVALGLLVFVRPHNEVRVQEAGRAQTPYLVTHLRGPAKTGIF